MAKLGEHFLVVFLGTLVNSRCNLKIVSVLKRPRPSEFSVGFVTTGGHFNVNIFPLGGTAKHSPARSGEQDVVFATSAGYGQATS